MEERNDGLLSEGKTHSVGIRGLAESVASKGLRVYMWLIRAC